MSFKFYNIKEKSHLFVKNILKYWNNFSRTLLSMDVEIDDEVNVSYVKMKNPTASEISFIRTRCPTKKVLKVSCSELGEL